MRIARTNEGLVALVRDRAPSYLGGTGRSPRVLAAMAAVDRAAFLPEGERDFAYADCPCPIGMGQTCSEPSMVAFMLDLLEVEPGQCVLEVGAGSGYASAVASVLASPGGFVLAAEIIPELALAARANLALAGPSRGSTFADSVTLVEADASLGLPERGPWDRILVSAGVGSRGFAEAPLLAALGEGGILVYPEERGSLHRIAKEEGRLRRERWGSVAFVRLRGANS